MTPVRPPGRRASLAAVFAVGAVAAQAAAVDVVIFKDGFSVQGRRFKEMETVADRDNGSPFVIPKAGGFDMVEIGPKWFVFSNRAKQVGKLLDNVPAEKDLKAYKREVYVAPGGHLPAGGEFTAPPFDKDWKRTITIRTGGGNYAEVKQRIALISPRMIIAPSTNYAWYPRYDTREFPPEELRRLLSTHPELIEKDGPDPGKRLAIAQFFADVGPEWVPVARAEIERAKKDIPGPWPKEHAERLDRMTADLARLDAQLLVKDLAVAAEAGRYGAARELIAKFEDKAADAGTVKEFTALQARIEEVEPRFRSARRLLRATIDELAGGTGSTPAAALLGAVAFPTLRKEPDETASALAAAAEQVLGELHPDTADRVEAFRLLAADREKGRAAGKSGTPPAELAALAVSGWLMGKNGADKDTATALRYWGWRQALLRYQTEGNRNNRRQIARAFAGQGADEAGPDVLAQLISHLPPPEPEDLENPSGAKYLPGQTTVPGIRKVNTSQLLTNDKGVDYLIRLPAEYHHGRPYPVVLALTHHTLPPEQLISLLAPFADRAGYILAAPVWVTEFTPRGYDWSGDEHYKVQAVLRSLLRHYRVDNDRVFLFGFGEGANFAVDMGAAHPDLFAGVAAMGANPKVTNMMMAYWPNYQKLPLYIAVGGMAGAAAENLRLLYKQMMPMGCPAVASIYRGRGTEWFSGELPVMFDWMKPKVRVTGSAALKLNDTTRTEPWQTMRAADNRFYWIGTDSVAENRLLANRSEGKGIVPAYLSANVDGNLIRVRCMGVKNVILWLDRNMIDWDKPVKVSFLNGNAPVPFKPQKLKPDTDLMLEQLYEHGDRSLLFLNKIEIKTTP
jgi:pimeloyl-ACP methyl ester carboxylesterase